MPKQPNTETESLTGWQQIAEFLGQPVSVAERWAHTGMPVEHKGRRVYAFTRAGDEAAQACR